MYFAHELADEAVAYGPLAPSFLQIILQYYPVLLVLRATPGSGKYPNVVLLFHAWLGAPKSKTRNSSYREFSINCPRCSGLGQPIRNFLVLSVLILTMDVGAYSYTRMALATLTRN